MCTDVANWGSIQRALWETIRSWGTLGPGSPLVLLPRQITLPLFGAASPSCQWACLSPSPLTPHQAVHWHTASISTVCWKKRIHFFCMASYITDHSLLAFQVASSTTISESVPQGPEVWQFLDYFTFPNLFPPLYSVFPDQLRCIIVANALNFCAPVFCSRPLAKPQLRVNFITELL